MEFPSPIENFRPREHGVDPIFIKRWSPRSMTGGKIELQTLMSLFEAARWAPSSSNMQPWRFIYALHGSPAFDQFYECLARGNKAWCDKASALILVVSQTHLEENKPIKTHSFDTGSAWMSLALQGSLLNLVVHGMAGFDYEKMKEVVSLPEGYAVEAMAAVGFPASADQLDEGQREREKPNTRKHPEEFVFEGEWPK